MGGEPSTASGKRLTRVLGPGDPHLFDLIGRAEHQLEMLVQIHKWAVDAALAESERRTANRGHLGSTLHRGQARNCRWNCLWLGGKGT